MSKSITTADLIATCLRIKPKFVFIGPPEGITLKRNEPNMNNSTTSINQILTDKMIVGEVRDHEELKQIIDMALTSVNK